MHIVITTINGPDHGALPAWRAFAVENNHKLVVVADGKTPTEGWPVGELLDVAEQARRFPALSRAIGWDNYARKNLGYAAAIADGAEAIMESDDDNWPLPTLHGLIGQYLSKVTVNEAQLEQGRALNHLSLMQCQNGRVWPRGFPWTQLNRERHSFHWQPKVLQPLVTQFACEGEPDRDAAHRLLYPERKFTCNPDALPMTAVPGAWVPFNSQMTLWRKEAFPLMCIPSRCDFRADDIWRGYVTGRALAERGESVVIGRPAVMQERNNHDLLRDLASEQRMYLLTDAVLAALAAPLESSGDLGRLNELARRMVAVGAYGRGELECVEAWRNTLCAIT